MMTFSLSSFTPVRSTVGLFLVLSYSSWLGASAGQNSDRSFGEKLEEYGKVVESFASGLKTAGKVAKLLTGEVEFGQEDVEDCRFTCRNGATPRHKLGYIPEANGCGAYGLKVDLSKLPDMERCCNKHDQCYGKCGTEKEACDVKFAKCLENVCTKLLRTIGLNEEESEGCTMTVQLMYMSVMELGCQAYLDSQKDACDCRLQQADNRTTKKEL